MDPILKKQYNIISDPINLATESDIFPYFMEYGDEYFDCGQGYSQYEATVYVEIKDVYYKVDISANVTSAKQDRGDRLYWVENIANVVHIEIPKPELKSEELITVYIKEYQLEHAIDVLKNAGIEYLLSKTGDE
jgi:hypothetical protein